MSLFIIRQKWFMINVVVFYVCGNKVLLTCGLNRRSLFSPSPGGQKSEVKVLTAVLPSGGPEGEADASLSASGGCQQSLTFLVLQKHRFNFCFHIHMMFFSLCVSLYLNFPLPSSYKGTWSLYWDPLSFGMISC